MSAKLKYMRSLKRPLALALIIVGSAAATGATEAVPTCFGKPATIVGTSLDDVISGTLGDDVIAALGGRDNVHSGEGNDLVCLGPGGDTETRTERANGGLGEDKISGGDGDDKIAGVRGDDVLFGGPGRDTLFGGAGSDRLYGQAGRDILEDGEGPDSVSGGDGDDFVFLHWTDDDEVMGGADGRYGDTVAFDWPAEGGPQHGVQVDLRLGISRGRGRDLVHGIERVFGTDHDDVLIGDRYANVLFPSLGRDDVRGGAGDDCLLLSVSSGSFDGGSGFDILLAGSSDCIADDFGGALTPSFTGVEIDLSAGTAQRSGGGQTIEASVRNIEGAVGSAQEDRLIGDASENYLHGTGGADEIFGGEGPDRIDGGSGIDRVDGEAGEDACINSEVRFSCEKDEFPWLITRWTR